MYTLELYSHVSELYFSSFSQVDFFGLQENADLLVSLRGAIFFDSKKKGVDQVLISMGIGELVETSILTFEKLTCISTLIGLEIYIKCIM